MNKSVLVINNSSTCEKCELHCITYGCKKVMKRYEKYKEGKPDWCPLKPLHEKECRSDCYDEYEDGYADGWNSLLNQICQ